MCAQCIEICLVENPDVKSQELCLHLVIHMWGDLARINMVRSKDHLAFSHGKMTQERQDMWVLGIWLMHVV